MRVIDIITFNGESDLLEIRLNILNDFVDEFVIVEARTTFSGKPKPLYYEQEKERYQAFAHKIKYFVIDESYDPETMALSDASPNTKGANHWKREFCQKESIKKALTHLHDHDLCFIGDCDEIWNPEYCLDLGEENPIKIELKVYTYSLNNKSSEEFYGTLIAPYARIKNECLNHLRTNSEKFLSNEILGWHFTSMGGYESVKRKLSDSYTEESYWSLAVQQGLERNIHENRDFLGRDFTYEIDDSQLPSYISNNRHLYEHLFR